MKRVTLIVPVLLLMFSPLPIALGILNQQSTPQVVFSDDFESYASTATCNSVNDNCFAPPHIGNKMNLPSYWVPASSDTCVTRGGCTKWDGNGHMGPNSVFAVVTEQAASGSKSIKLGASDWYADKTSMAVWLSLNNFPSGQLVSLSFKVWLSLGIDNPACHCNKYGSGPNNALTIQTPVGKIRYFGQIGSTSGLWEVQNSPISTGGLFANIGSYHLTTQTWHTITLTFDWTNSHWDSLVIDGQQPFANVNGYPTYDPFISGSGYEDFAVFIVPYADNQSITSAPSHGFQPYYAYVDDVAVSLGPVSSTTSSSVTSVSSIQTTSTTSSTMSLTATTGIFDFAVNVNPAIASVIQGGGTTATVTVTLVSGTSQPVSLSSSVSPTTPTISTGFSPASGNPTFTSTLTIGTSANTPAGAYTITITGSGGGLTRSTVFTLTATSASPDLSISASPSSLSILIGSSGTWTVTVTSVNGFSSSVSLSVTSPPISGVTTGFSPTSVTPTSGGSASSSLAISVGTSASVGTYSMTVTGTSISPSLSHSTTISLAVSDFSLSASPNSLSIQQGTSGSSTITVASLNGFSGTVSVAASAPAGLTATLSSTSLAVTSGGSASSTLSIAVSSSTTAGTYIVTVTGTSGSLNHSTTVTVTVQAASSAPQNLVASAGNAQVTLSWSAPLSNGGSPITNYRIYRGTVSGVETLLITIGNVLTYTDTAVTNGQTYYYQVSSVNSVGESPRSNEASATPSASSFDFSVSVNPTSSLVAQGDSTTANVAVTLLAGTAQPVSLSASVSPAEPSISVGFSPSSANPTFTSSMTIATSDSTPPGVYIITITATAGGLSRSTSFMLTVQ